MHAQRIYLPRRSTCSLDMYRESVVRDAGMHVYNILYTVYVFLSDRQSSMSKILQVSLPDLSEMGPGNIPTGHKEQQATEDLCVLHVGILCVVQDFQNSIKGGL